MGLSAFGKQDAPLFFGCRQETLKALEGLGYQQLIHPQKSQRTSEDKYYRWLQIEGNSGSGKSSLVSAGMLPLIEQGFLLERTGFTQWRILGPMMPGKTPLEQGLIGDPARRDSLGRLKQLKEDTRALAFAIKDLKQP